MASFIERHRIGLRLFTLVFLTLYAELALIRYASAQIRYLGYFSNFILIAVFLGIGLGFLLENKKITLFKLSPFIFLGWMAFVVLATPHVGILRHGFGQLYFGPDLEKNLIPLWISLPVIFGGTAFLFSCIAQETARAFHHYSPILTYSIDIGGSLAGIAFFTLHSFSGGHPIAWFIVVYLLFLILSERKQWLTTLLCLAGIIALLIYQEPQHYVSWSPYQKIEVVQGPSGPIVGANGIGHQVMYMPGKGEETYNFPYEEIVPKRGKPFEKILIIGSGSGSDVSYALSQGVKEVHAVEIDPEIQFAGKLFHPAEPYDDERVTIFIDDGRSFMEHTKESYDMVLFALPDSLALVSSFSNIRLESYLFTMESFAAAKKLLKPDGVLVLYNFYREHWLREKLALMLEEVFGHPPLIKRYRQDKDGMLGSLAVGPSLRGENLSFDKTSNKLATDDWPFLYMQSPHIPPLYIAVMVMMLLFALGITYKLRPQSLAPKTINAAFFFMGAAFLLLETKSIIQFSLLFGATWLINALVFAAILASILLANWCVVIFKIEKPFIIFAALFIALGLNLIIPLENLLSIESLWLRYLLSSTLIFSPIFFANLIFGFLFKDSQESTEAFGWNILGAMFGGTCETIVLLIGYSNLTILVAIFYALCAFFLFKTKARLTSSFS
ncbi:MAG: spermidine synthase [Myxococcales bacterium]|nr:spermidine synthase [Myxococcales bacterium]